jgi:hypothetical protein
MAQGFPEPGLRSQAVVTVCQQGLRTLVGNRIIGQINILIVGYGYKGASLANKVLNAWL